MLPRSLALVALLSATTTLGGCGGTAPASGEPTPARGAGSVHAVVHPENGTARALAVDYAAAGLGTLAPSPSDDGSLVIVAVFRDGRVDDSLDLETLSISVPLAELPGATGSLDVVVDGSALAVLLEGSSNGETRVVSPEAVGGTLHLRYDAPPRPGITLRGDFSLVIPTGSLFPGASHLDANPRPVGSGPTLKLEGELEVPVLGS